MTEPSSLKIIFLLPHITTSVIPVPPSTICLDFVAAASVPIAIESLTPESAKQLVVELEKVLEDIPIESEEILKDFYSPRCRVTR